jgi:hypothetical protein
MSGPFCPKAFECRQGDVVPPDAMQPFAERFGELRGISLEERQLEGFQVMA